MGVATILRAAEGDVERQTGLEVRSASIKKNVNAPNNAQVLSGISSCAE
jgi:hypothetical protein